LQPLPDKSQPFTRLGWSSFDGCASWVGARRPSANHCRHCVGRRSRCRHDAVGGLRPPCRETSRSRGPDHLSSAVWLAQRGPRRRRHSILLPSVLKRVAPCSAASTALRAAPPPLRGAPEAGLDPGGLTRTLPAMMAGVTTRGACGGRCIRSGNDALRLLKGLDQAEGSAPPRRRTSPGYQGQSPWLFRHPRGIRTC